MYPELYGYQHIIYLIIFFGLSISSLILIKKYVKSEKTLSIILKSLGGALLISILLNRFSIFYFKSNPHDPKLLLPDSYCGLTSLVLALAVLFGKKDNYAYHYLWLMGILGGGITVFYPDFIGQNQSFFYLPTISGLLHHSITLYICVYLIIFDFVHITYKKWYCTLIGFAFYMTYAVYLISLIGIDDALHIFTPLLSGTPLYAWFLSILYAVLYAVILLVIELVRNHLNKKAQINEVEPK
ncbi:MAG: hypothetical protein ACI311_06470 [Bacilli bacterium]